MSEFHLNLSQVDYCIDTGSTACHSTELSDFSINQIISDHSSFRSDLIQSRSGQQEDIAAQSICALAVLNCLPSSPWNSSSTGASSPCKRTLLSHIGITHINADHTHHTDHAGASHVSVRWTAAAAAGAGGADDGAENVALTAVQ